MSGVKTNNYINRKAIRIDNYGGAYYMSKKKRKRDTSATSGDDAITINKSTLWQVAAAAFGILFLISLATGGFGLGADNPTQATTQNGNNQPSQDNSGTTDSGGQAEVTFEGAHSKGNEDSSVTLTEFSSMTCPFCGRHNSQTHPQLRQEFIETGDIRYVYKHFARNELDVQAANAAECAGEQGQFFEYKNLIFDNQDNLSQDLLPQLAEQLDLDMEQWSECNENDEFRDKVISDTEEARSLGITGTPGFVINGEVISGAQPYQTFQQAIQSELG